MRYRLYYTRVIGMGRGGGGVSIRMLLLLGIADITMAI